MTRVFSFLIVMLLFFSNRSIAQTIPSWKLAELTAAIDRSTGPTIINFWATFCKPCIAELPAFQAMANRYKDSGVSLIMVSLDLPEAYPAKVASFTKRLHLTSPVVFLNENNADVFCPAVDSSWSGAIPATLFINHKTGYRRFYEEEFSRERLEVEIRRMLQTSSNRQ